VRLQHVRVCACAGYKKGKGWHVGWRMEDGGWRMEDGGLRMEDGEGGTNVGK
jgi:hypothetical protein